MALISFIGPDLYFIVDNSPGREGYYYIKSNFDIVNTLDSTIEDESTQARSKIYKAITIKKDQLDKFLYGNRVTNRTLEK